MTSSHAPCKSKTNNTEDSKTEVPREENFYSGEADYLYSTKLAKKLSLAEACETLVASPLFPLALNSSGRMYYKCSSRINSRQLKFTHSICGLGMTVKGHQEYLTNNPGAYNSILFLKALDLHLSQKKLFTDRPDSLGVSARIFMRPIAVKLEGHEEHEIFRPSFRIYNDGTITATLSPLLGFSELAADKVVNIVTNKAKNNIESVLCEKDSYLALNETQAALLPFKQRYAQRRTICENIEIGLAKTATLEILEEKFETHELLQAETFTLSDLAHWLLALIERSITNGHVRNKIQWTAAQHISNTLSKTWFGKPIVYIQDHTNQLASANDNWVAHNHLIQCIMARTYLKDPYKLPEVTITDLRAFDDYNSFYSEAVSLVFSSTQVSEFISNAESYTFSNLTSDILILNETAHHLLVHYGYLCTDIDKCLTTTKISQADIKNIEFETSFISIQKYGETSKYFEKILLSDSLGIFKNLAQKKIDTRRKYLELEEKIAADSQTRRMTLVFGIVASASLSPELMQPLLKVLGFQIETKEINKLVGILLSGCAVLFIALTINFSAKLFKSIFFKNR